MGRHPGRESKPGRGNIASGTKKGDVYGDMYVLLRDANGVPILKQLADGTWVVQPVDKDGNVLPLDAEGNLINPRIGHRGRTGAAQCRPFAADRAERAV